MSVKLSCLHSEYKVYIIQWCRCSFRFGLLTNAKGKMLGCPAKPVMAGYYATPRENEMSGDRGETMTKQISVSLLQLQA